MVNLKTDQEIEVMKEGGNKLKWVVEKLLTSIREGVTTKEIDDKAEKLIKIQGGESSFKTVSGYSFSTCTPINEQIVHTKPSSRTLKEGDVLTLDIGMLYKGWHTDYATTKVVSGQNKDVIINRFLKIGEETLYQAIKEAKIGNRIGEISEVIEKNIT